MADRISELYKFAKNRGVLKSGLTEDMFRKQTESDEGLKSFYDYATNQGVRFEPFDKFKESARGLVDSNGNRVDTTATIQQQEQQPQVDTRAAVAPQPQQQIGSSLDTSAQPVAKNPYEDFSDEELHGIEQNLLEEGERKRQALIDETKNTKQNKIASLFNAPQLNANQVENMVTTEGALNDTEREELKQVRETLGRRAAAKGFDAEKEALRKDTERVNKEIDNAIKENGIGDINLESAKYLNKKAEEVLNAPTKFDNKDGMDAAWQGVKNMWSGIENNLFDRQVLSIIDLQRNVRLSNIVKKLNNEEQLSNSESELLNAYLNLANAQAARQNDLSLGYKMGEGAAQSVPFMVDMLLTKGLIGAPAKKAIVKTVTKNLGEAAGKNWAKWLGTEGKRNVGQYLAYEAAATPVQTGLMASSWSQVFEDKANNMLESGKTDWDFKDFSRSLTNMYVETLTERAGGKMIDEVAKFIPSIGKIWGNNKIASAVTGYIQDPLTETAEEYLGAGINAIRSLNPLYSQESNEQMRGEAQQMLTPEGFAQTFGTVLPMTLFGGAVNMGTTWYAGYKYNDARTKLRSMIESYGATPEQSENIMSQLEKVSADPEQFKEYTYKTYDNLVGLAHEKDNGEISNDEWKNISDVVRDYQKAALNFNTNMAQLKEQMLNLTPEQKAEMQAELDNAIAQLWQIPEQAAAEQAAAEIDTQTNLDDNQIHGVYIGNDPNNQAFITGGQVAYNEDGTIDTFNSSPYVYIRRMSDNKVVSIPTKELTSMGAPLSAEQIKTNAEAHAAAVAGVKQTFQVGDEIQLQGQLQGITDESAKILDIDEDGNVTIETDQGPQQLSADFVIGNFQPAQPQSEVGNEPAHGNIVEWKGEGMNSVFGYQLPDGRWQITDKDGNVMSGNNTFSEEDFANMGLSQVEEMKPTATIESITPDVKRMMDEVQSDEIPTDIFKYIQNQLGVDEKGAMEVFQQIGEQWFSDRWEFDKNGNAHNIVNEMNTAKSYDEAEGTELYRFLHYIANGKKLKGNESWSFKLGKAKDVLTSLGIVGDIYATTRTVNPKKHTQDADHELGVKEWLDAITQINTPIAVTKYKDADNKYRIYTNATVNGKNICVGVDVNSAGNNVQVTDIVTAFGRDINKIKNANNETLIYPKTEQAPDQFSQGPNSPVYNQVLETDGKITTNISNTQIIPQENAKKTANEGKIAAAQAKADAELETLKALLKQAKENNIKLGISAIEQQREDAELTRQVIASGARLVSAYVEQGVYKFADICDKVFSELGELGSLIHNNTIKKMYLNAKVDASDEIYNLMDSEDVVRKFDIANYKPQTKQENEQRNSETIASEAEAVASQAEVVAESATTETEINDAMTAVDEEVEKIDNQLMLLGYYESANDESEYGHSKKAEAAAKRDVTKLAKKLAKDLGVEPNVKAVANIAPAGGDVYFHLPLWDGNNLYVTIPMKHNGYSLEYMSSEDAQADGAKMTGKYGDLYIPNGIGAYTIDNIMYRIENDSKAGQSRYVSGNEHINYGENPSYDNILSHIRSTIKQNLNRDYVSQQEANKEQTTVAKFKVGDKIIYKGNYKGIIESVNADGTYDFKYQNAFGIDTHVVNVKENDISALQNEKSDEKVLSNEEKSVPLQGVSTKGAKVEEPKLDKNDYRTYLAEGANDAIIEANPEKFAKFAHPELAFVSQASWDGVKIPVDVLMQQPSIAEAQKKIDEKHGSAVLSPEQTAELAKDLLLKAGDVKKEKKAFIVIGRPAGGKSTVFAEPIAKKNNAAIIDSDDVKPLIDGYDKGYGAGYVQQASSTVADEALKYAVSQGYNIVIPKIGGKSIVNQAIELKKNGYRVELYFNEVSTESSIMRAASRFAQKGRYLSLTYLQSIGDKPNKTFVNYANKTLKDAEYEIKSSGQANAGGYGTSVQYEGNGGNETTSGENEGVMLFDYAEWKNNDVPYGSEPKEIWDSESGKPIPGTNSVRKLTPRPNESLDEFAARAAEVLTTNNTPNNERGEFRPNQQGLSSENGEVGEREQHATQHPNEGGVAGRNRENPTPDQNGSGSLAGQLNKNNYHATRGSSVPTTSKARFDANIAAIRLMKELTENGKQATKGQKQVLAQYSGWGGLGTYFNNQYSPEYQTLKSLLDDQELHEAANSINTAYYTPANITDILWDVAEKLGFKGGDILEGSAGIGNIISQIPNDINGVSHIQAVEYDSTTGNILRLLYPDAQVNIDGFQNVPIRPQSKDLVITNVPFDSRLKVTDEKNMDITKSFGLIHDFCIAKNVRALREGGLGIFISTNNTLDKDYELFKWLSEHEHADVIGAFRLNNKTFEGAPVTSDIIVVRKRINNEPSAQTIDVSTVHTERIYDYDTNADAWYRRSNKEKEADTKHIAIRYNTYFAEHPENMGGEMKANAEMGDTFRPESLGLHPTEKINQDKRLKTWVGQFTEEQSNQSNEQPQSQNQSTEQREGTLSVDDNGNVFVAQNGQLVPLKVSISKIKGHPLNEVLQDYRSIQDALNSVLNYETTNDSDTELEPLLQKLNDVYDNFVDKYGHFHNNRSLTWLRNDLDYSSVAEIETYHVKEDEHGKKMDIFGKADVMNKRVMNKSVEAKADNITDAIVVSIRQKGLVDTKYIGELLGRDADDIRQEALKTGLVFEDPATGGLIVKYEYLSGNIMDKLDVARANNTDGQYDKNIEELERVKPITIPSHLISVSLGTTWIEPGVYEDYIAEKTGMDRETVKVTKVEGKWDVQANGWSSKNNSEGVHSEICNKIITIADLLEAAINNQSIVVKKQTKEDGTIIDKDASQICSSRIDEYKDDFTQWFSDKVQKDAELSKRVEDVYNRLYNQFVPLRVSKEFIPEHFDGANKGITLNEWQSHVAVRATVEPLMFAHEVGAGKTFAMVTTAMEMRRLGQAKKPMIVVQNQTARSFVNDARNLYPNAKILTISDKDNGAEGRMAFYRKIKYNDWDMIIIPQSVFNMIPESQKRKEQFIQERIDEKIHAMQAIEDERMRASVQKEIDALEEMLKNDKMVSYYRSQGLTKDEAVKQTKTQAKSEAERIEAIMEKAKRQLARKTDDIESFDDMDIDALFIDEAHEYKHLGFESATGWGIKGIDKTSSGKAVSLYCKMQAVFDKTGHKNVVFATGTPISNTAAEVWTFMKYLLPKDVLVENNVYYFDDFVHNFGKIIQRPEFKTDGKFKTVTRFAEYNNVPELVRLWTRCSDTVLSPEKLKEKQPITVEGEHKATDIFLPQSKSLRLVMKHVREELERYENMSGAEKKENSSIPLIMYGLASAAAVDPRLVGDFPDEQNSKTNAAVKRIVELLDESKEYNGTISVFSDRIRRKVDGVEKFNIFEDIKQKLIQAGIPANQIAIISDQNRDQKQRIFDKVNSGEIRVIMGSTQKLGVGVNIQERMFGQIHLDAPNRPMDYQQRVGRIIRQGNLHREWDIPVHVIRFGVEDSLDVTAYQRLKTKTSFSDSIMKLANTMNLDSKVVDGLSNRNMEEEDDTAGDFDNMIATISGSEYAMLISNEERKLRKLEAEKSQYINNQVWLASKIDSAEKSVKYGKAAAKQVQGRIDVLNKKLDNGAVTNISINGTDITDPKVADKVYKEINAQVEAEANNTRDYEIYSTPKRLSVVKCNINGIDMEFRSAIELATSWENGREVRSRKLRWTVSIPELGVEHICNGRWLKGAIADVTSEELSLEAQQNELAAMNKMVEENENLIKDYTEQQKKTFDKDADIKQIQEHLVTLRKKMEEEMAEKQKKYAEMDKQLGDADIDLSHTDIEGDDEEDNGDTENQISEGIGITPEGIAITNALAEHLRNRGVEVVEVDADDVVGEDSIIDYEEQQKISTNARPTERFTDSADAKEIAKLQQKNELCKENLKNVAEKYKGVKNAKGFITDLSLALQSNNGYSVFLLPDGRLFEVRVSNHNANADNFVDKNADVFVSVVVKSKLSPNTFISNDNVSLKEYVYTKERIASSKEDILSSIAEDLDKAITTGVFPNSKKAAIVNESVLKNDELKQLGWYKKTSVRPEYHIVNSSSEEKMLDNDPDGYVKAYCTLAKINGKYYSPMATLEKGDNGKNTLTQPIEVGEWYKSNERTLSDPLVREKEDGTGWEYHLIKPDGTDMWVAYDPYWHSTTSPLNDQFTSAWRRPELVTVEVLIPRSDIESGYKADGALLPTGEHDWNSGPVSASLKASGKGRKVILSQYRKIVGEISAKQEAENIAKYLEGTFSAIPINTIRPQVRDELIKLGVKFTDINGNAGKGTQELNNILSKLGRQYVKTDKKNKKIEFQNGNGEVYGWYKDGKIYLVKGRLNPNTAVHEATHMLAAIMRDKNSKGWEDIVRICKENKSLWDAVVNDPNYNLTTDDEIASEVIARYSGKRGGERLEEEVKKAMQEQDSIAGLARTRVLYNNVREALRKFWGWVTDLFHVTNFKDIDEVADMFLDEILNDTQLPTPPRGGRREEQRITFPEYNPRLSLGENLKIANEQWNNLATDEAINKYNAELTKLRSGKNGNMGYRAAQTRWIDAASPIENFQKYFKGNEDIPSEQDAYSDTFLAQGRISHSQEVYERRFIRPLRDAVKAIIDSKKLDSLEVTWQNLTDEDAKEDKNRKNGHQLTARELIGIYCQAKDVQECIEMENMPDRGAEGFIQLLGKSHLEIIDMVENAVPAEMINNLWDAIRKATSFSLDYQVENGFITKADRAKYNRQFYVPERGWKERDFAAIENDYFKFGKYYNQPYNKALRKSYGRKSLASDPFGYIWNIADSTITTVEKNKTKVKLLEYCLEHEKEGAEAGAFRISKFWMLRNLDKDGNPIMINETDPQTGESIQVPSTSISYAEPTAEMYEHDEQLREQIDKLVRKQNKLVREKSYWYKKVLNDPSIDERIIGIATSNIASIDEKIEKIEKEIGELSGKIQIMSASEYSGLSMRTKDEQKQHHVYAVKDGQQYEMWFKDERVAQSINKDYDKWTEANNVFTKGVRGATRLLSAALTQYNPEFAASNFLRDYQVALTSIAAEKGADWEKEFLKQFNSPKLQAAVWAYAANDKVVNQTKFTDSQYGDYLNEYFEHGAQTGFSYLKNLDVMQQNFNEMLNEGKAKRIAKGTLGALSMLTEVSETAIRFAGYVTAREKGMSADEAAIFAKELTTNFDRGGTVSKSSAMAMWSFFRATINGNYKFAKGLRYFTTRYTIAAAAYLVMGALNALLNPDDPDDDVYFGSYVRESNFALKLFGITAKIPVAHFLRMFFAMGNNSVQWIMGRKSGERAIYDTVLFCGDELLPNYLNFTNFIGYDPKTNNVSFDGRQYVQGALPTPLSPIADVLLNVDFTGRSIDGTHNEKWYENKKDILKYRSDVPILYKQICDGLYEGVGGNLNVQNKADDNVVQNLLDISPSSLQHIVEGYRPPFLDLMATLGTLIYYAVDDEKTVSVENIPFIRKFYSDYKPDRQFRNEYWLLNGRVESYKNLLKDEQNGNSKKYNEMINSPEYDVYDEADKFLNALGKEGEPTKYNIKRLMELNKQWNKAY